MWRTLRFMIAWFNVLYCPRKGCLSHPNSGDKFFYCLNLDTVFGAQEMAIITEFRLECFISFLQTCNTLAVDVRSLKIDTITEFSMLALP